MRRNAERLAAQTLAAQTVAAQTLAAQTLAAQTLAAQTLAAQRLARVMLGAAMLTLCSACLLDPTGKDRCRSDEDCVVGYLCEGDTCVEDPFFDLEPDAEPGVEPDAACGGCPSEERCNVDRCMRSAMDGERFLCGPGEPCPDDQDCLNGVCASSCADDFDCPLGGDCDQAWGLCVPGRVRDCPQTPCEVNQVCVRGLCAAVIEAKPCEEPIGGSVDGCAADERCIVPSAYYGDFLALDGPSCVSRPACEEDGACPRDPFGGACSDGRLPGKARICLSGRCVDSFDCNLDYGDCIMLGRDDDYGMGYCSDGEQGAPCASHQDCESGTCSCISGDTCDERGQCQ